jgi:hypothetical protein
LEPVGGPNNLRFQNRAPNLGPTDGLRESKSFLNLQIKFCIVYAPFLETGFAAVTFDLKQVMNYSTVPSI